MPTQPAREMHGSCELWRRIPRSIRARTRADRYRHPLVPARVAAEGLNCTLTGPHEGIRAFTKELGEFAPEHFGNLATFKFVDNQPQNQMLKGLKVFPVSELGG